MEFVIATVAVLVVLLLVRISRSAKRGPSPAEALAPLVEKEDTLFGVRRIFLRTPVAWIHHPDPSVRHLPFLPAEELVLESADEQMYEVCGVAVKPDLVYRVTNGPRLVVEYKSQPGAGRRTNRNWVQSIKDVDCIQALIAAWAVSKKHDCVCRAVLRVPNGLVVMDAPDGFAEVVQRCVPGTQSLLGLNPRQSVWSSRLAPAVIMAMKGQTKQAATGVTRLGEIYHEQFVG